MSFGARIIIGIFTVLFSAMMFLHGTTANPKTAWFSYVFGVFCLFIGATLFLKGPARQFCGSIVAICIIIVGLFYLGNEIFYGELISESKGKPSILNAIFFMIAFGIPSVLYVVNVKFGFANNVDKEIDKKETTLKIED